MLEALNFRGSFSIERVLYRDVFAPQSRYVSRSDSYKSFLNDAKSFVYAATSRGSSFSFMLVLNASVELWKLFIALVGSSSAKSRR